MASIQWTKHLKSEKEREDFLAILGNSTTVLMRLEAILRDELEDMSRQESSVSDFEDLAWSHKQAFRNGDRARLRKVLDLIQIKRK